MFDWLVQTITDHPYLGVAAVFLVCGLGFPLPEEIVLVAAGYVCFKNWAALPPMITASAVAILAGDLFSFVLGRTFGPRLLRLRPLRVLINKRRLSTFDRWFRKRGDLVIFFARFVTGLRMVAYFTAGTMRMPYRRFITLDLIGIAVVVPLFIWLGYSCGNFIDEAIAGVQRAERGVLIAAGAAALLALLWFWLVSRRRRLRQATAAPSETFVRPSIDAAAVASPSQPAQPAGDAGAGTAGARDGSSGGSGSSGGRDSGGGVGGGGGRGAGRAGAGGDLSCNPSDPARVPPAAPPEAARGDEAQSAG
jgi:membrane protein DedA with SNARE-associated domain